MWSSCCFDVQGGFKPQWGIQKDNFYLFYIFQMKHLVLCLCLSAVAFSGLVTLSSNCPEQFVANADNICIQPLFIEGCQTYKNVNECADCERGYDNTQGKCLLTVESSLISTVMPGCLKGDAQTCFNCANGFRKVDGACSEGTKFCVDYGSEGNCIKCNIEYSLIFGECKHNHLLGCKVEKADHSCQECFKPFLLENYQCTIPSCKSYNDYGCFACECGFYITNTHNCQPMKNGCLKTYRGTCVECLPHYKLNGGVCSIEGCVELKEGLCTVCKTEYELADGTCTFKNCFDWKDDTCLICEAGFNLLNGRCVASQGKFVCEG